MAIRIHPAANAFPQMTESELGELAADIKRLSSQCDAILTRLQRGPGSNVDLAAIALKYTSRVGDLRAAGYKIDCERWAGGLTICTLRKEH